jgi:hypothetical protein
MIQPLIKAKANVAEIESFTHWHACDIPFVASANRATGKESANLWHQRLGHIRMRDLQNLVTSNKITVIKLSAKTLAKA